MPRRMRRTSRSVRVYRPLKTVKYSNETLSTLITIPSGDWPNATAAGTYKIPIILSPTSVAGVRKVKNISVRIASAFGTVEVPGVGLAAIVYVPEGTNKDAIQLSTDIESSISLYEPNQNVIAAGTFNYASSSPTFLGNRLARNLNSNDTIMLCIKPCSVVPANASVGLCVTINYAICFS